MALEWRPQSDPPEIPLKLIAHEDFVRELAFSGQVNTFPTGTTINLLIYPDSNLGSSAIATWPATVDLDESTGAWSVDYATVDAVALSGGRGFYRLMLSLPNPSDVGNPTVDRCIALGKITRK